MNSAAEEGASVSSKADLQEGMGLNLSRVQIRPQCKGNVFKKIRKCTFKLKAVPLLVPSLWQRTEA